MRKNPKPHMRGTEGLGNQGGGPQGVYDPAVSKVTGGAGSINGTNNDGDVTMARVSGKQEQVRPDSGQSRGGLGN